MEPRPLDHDFALEYAWRDGTCVRRKKRSNLRRDRDDTCNGLCMLPTLIDMKTSNMAGNVN